MSMNSQVMTRLSLLEALKALEGDTSDIGVPAVQKLVEELDVPIPEPARDTDKPFLMPVEDVFTISGRGTVVTGRIETGIVKTGDPLEIVGINDTTETTCTGVEMFRKSLDEGRAGENCGVLLRGIDRDAVERGKFYLLLNQLHRTQNSKLKFMYFQRMKVEDTLHSLKVIDLSFILELLMLQAPVNYQMGLRW